MKPNEKAIFWAVLAGFFLPMVFLYIWRGGDDGTSARGHYTPTIRSPKPVGSHLSALQVATLDARNSERWVYFNFDLGVPVDTVKDALNWDLGVRRHSFITNGGATNPAGRGGALNLGPVNFYAVAEAPADGYLQDSATNPTETKNDVLEPWYRYEWRSHTLISHDDVYVIRTALGRYAKFRILNYYCDEHNPGCMTIEYVYQGDGSRRLGPQKTTMAAPLSPQKGTP